MATVDQVETLDIGQVVSRAFGAIGRNPVLFLGLAIILEVIPNLLIQGVRMALVVPGQAPAFGVFTVVSGLVGMILYFLFQASVVHATAVDLGGGKPTLGTSLGLAARLVLPLAGLTIVVLFGVSLASMLLLIPGIIVAMMWFVAVPALVEERGGVLASLGRSRALTKGSRWRLFALAIVMAILIYVPFLVLSLAGGGFMAASLALSQMSVIGVTLAVFNAAIGIVISAIVASAYVELRMVKEGATSESLAAIFA